eukprot:CAMPEP_0197905706 /NCGR_PEP_ID=MMETSP1439-20131203/60964_1 /TAXON_ID=66791 /ORGANISM="Gonyaulax spinifera, Strain CCMP409" /LENGTH=177 /DNA_ID=CAMNT_0043526997 /DNA_START=79 /DNA_END=613 /DNA_ORIENTATION=+
MAVEPDAKRARVGKPAYALNLNKFLDKDMEVKSLHEIVDKPVSALQGLAALGTEALNARHVKTVKDLANWKFFKIANSLVTCELADESGGRDDASELNANKAVDKAWETKSITEILDGPVSALQGLTEKDDENFAKVHVKSVRALGTWKYARWAEAICVLAENETSTTQADDVTVVS